MLLTLFIFNVTAENQEGKTSFITSHITDWERLVSALLNKILYYYK